MDLPYTSVTDIYLFLLMFTRIVTMVALLPVFGSSNVPVAAKVGIAIIVSLILFPMAGGRENIGAVDSFLGFSVLLVKEAAVGLVVGFVSSMLFTGLLLAAAMIDLQMGFSFVQVVDPFTETETTVMGQLKVLVFTLVFLLINGHYFMLLAVQKSFEMIPVLGVHLPGGKLAWFLTEVTGGVFLTGLKLGAPVFITVVLTEVALGVVARTVPQMNIFFVGMPLKIGIGLLTSVIVLPVLVALFRGMVQELVGNIWKLLYLMA